MIFNISSLFSENNEEIDQKHDISLRKQISNLLTIKETEKLELSNLKQIKEKLFMSIDESDSFSNCQVDDFLDDIQRTVSNLGSNLEDNTLESAFILISIIEEILMTKKQNKHKSIKFKIHKIVRFLAKRFKSVDELFRFSNSLTQKNPNGSRLENYSQVIFSDIIQELLIKPAFDSDKCIQQTTNYFLKEFNNIEASHPIKQAILLAIFRQICMTSVTQIQNPILVSNQLKEYFQNQLKLPFQIYIMKQFYYQQTPMLKEPLIFQDCKWIHSLKENLKISCLYSHWQQIISFIEESIPKSQNVFSQIFNNSFNKSLYYPFMMLNNITFLYENTFDNKTTHLYSCPCGEYIFSANCPDLPVLESNKCARCDRKITKEQNILQNIQSNLPKLESLMNSTAWTGFYLNFISETFKLKEGNSLDFQICALIYCQSMLSAIRKQKQLSGPSSYISINEAHNLSLRIYHKGDPEVFLSDKIKLLQSHISSELNRQNIKDNDQFQLLKVIISSLMIEKTIIGYSTPEQRSNANNSISSKISQIIKQFKKDWQNPKQLEQLLSEEIEPTGDGSQFKRFLRKSDPLNHESVEAKLFNEIKKMRFQILYTIMSNQNIEIISEFLPGFIEFTQILHNKFSRRLKLAQTREYSLLELLENNRSDPIFVYYSTIFIPLWNQYSSQKKTMRIGCEEILLPQFKEDTKLNELIFCNPLDSAGALQIEMELLIEDQNKFIQLACSVFKQNRSKQSHKVKSIFLKFVEQNSKTYQYKKYTEVIPSRHVLHKYDTDSFSDYAMNDVEYSKGKIFIEDFETLEQEIFAKVFSGVACISLSSKRFLFQKDIHQLNPFLESKIVQVDAPKQLKQEFLSMTTYEESSQILTILSTAFSEYQSCSLLGETPIQNKLKKLRANLKEGQLEKFFPYSLKLKHTASIIKELEKKWMPQLVEQCHPFFQRDLQQEQFENAYDLICQNIKIEEFVEALGRLIVRTLSVVIPTINPEGKLFEQLFDEDISGYFWEDSSKLEKIYPIFKNDSILISQSFSLYQKSINKLNPIS